MVRHADESPPRPRRAIRDADGPAAERARAVINAWGERPPAHLNAVIGKGEDIVHFRQGSQLFRRLDGGWEVWNLVDYVAAVAQGLAPGRWHPAFAPDPPARPDPPAPEAAGAEDPNEEAVALMRDSLVGMLGRCADPDGGGADAMLREMDGTIPYETIDRSQFAVVEETYRAIDVRLTGDGTIITLWQLRDLARGGNFDGRLPWFLLVNSPPIESGELPVTVGIE